MRLIERAEAAPFVDYRPVPKWVFFAAGLWAAIPVGMLWLNSTADFGGKTLLLVAGDVVLFAGLLGSIAWARRYYGVRQPKPWSKRPREIWRAYIGYLAGIASVIVLIWLAWLAAGWLTAMVAAVLTGGFGSWGYARAYDSQAAKVRARLGGGL